jgi:hypothetical protein
MKRTLAEVGDEGASDWEAPQGGTAGGL